MGVWGAIGKALNSTVKTSDCVPLNEIVQECANEIIDACEAKVPVSVTRIATVAGSPSGKVVINATGKGYIDIAIKVSAVGLTTTLVIDGKTLFSQAPFSSFPWFDANGDYTVLIKMRFNKSVKLTTYDTSMYTRGFVVFEE